jgi:NAD kinase
MSTTTARVGLVAKHYLDAAAGVLAELAGWLEARGAQAVFESETAALAGLPPGRPTQSRDDLPHHCDVIVVLGGDGTLIGMADRIAAASASSLKSRSMSCTNRSKPCSRAAPSSTAA